MIIKAFKFFRKMNFLDNFNILVVVKDQKMLGQLIFVKFIKLVDKI
jgi:hypothetical protein